MQALIRKLAGLDVFYVKSGANSAWSVSGQGQAYSKVDPLTEFIYGILGIGKNAATYKSLNTVFWSLSIFALIVLVVCTMIAIIKSHYNEDYASTNPWKYIYTAIKAILTYAAMPIIVVIGMQLATFVLTTLDKITAGQSNEETLKGIYGQNVVPLFEAGTGDFAGVYGRYDYFGYGSPTTATTFGGMLFKAAAYSSNRARTGSNTLDQYLSITHQGVQIFGNPSCVAYSSMQAGTDISTGSNVSGQTEYVAYQVDYAFQNNLKLNISLSITGALNEAFPDVPFLHWVDAPTYQTSMGSFSKYNVSAIWFFYDLWQFNFIVAFGGGVTIFGLVLSIVFGMMSRLIKGAALFLVYPTMLSIAPLDNFKAFKNWGQQFMSQVLMAIGSITAVNILMLLIPYLDSFSFFGIGIIDAIINMLLLITGIVMIKDFIQIVSGFIGSSDAASEGEKHKGNAFNAVKTGFNTAAKIGMGTARFAVGGARLAGSAIKAPIKAGVNRHRRNKYGKALNTLEAEKQTAQETAERAQRAAEKGTTLLDMKKAMLKGAAAGTSFEELGVEGTKENRELYQRMIANPGNAESVWNSSQQGRMLAVAERRASAQNMSVRDMFAARVKTTQEDVEKKQKAIEEAEEYAKKKGVKLKRAEVIERDASGKALTDENGNYKTKTVYRTKENKDDFDFKADKKALRRQAEDERVAMAHMMGDRAVNKYSKGGKALTTLKVATTPIRLVGKGVWNSFDAKKAGLQIADSFVKTLRSVPDALGFDKFLKGLKDTLKGSWTLKGGPFENFGKAKPLEGEVAQRDASNRRAEEARRQQEATKTTNDLLKDVIQELKANNEVVRRGNEAAKNYYARPKD